MKSKAFLSRSGSSAIRPFGAAFALAAGLLVYAPNIARSVVILVPHRAVYALSLVENTNQGSWESIGGRMVYELTGSACAGYRQQFRQLIILANSEGMRQVIDDYSWNNENSDGTLMEFGSKNMGKDEIVQTINGLAQRLSDGVQVHYTSPTRSEFTLPQQTSFPIAYTKSLISAAKDGRKKLDLLQFDGTDEAATAQNSFAIIGAEISGGTGPEIALSNKNFGKQKRWPVSIGFSHEGQLHSEYSIYQEIFENGVAINLILDFREFKLSGHLLDITILDEKKCN